MSGNDETSRENKEIGKRTHLNPQPEKIGRHQVVKCLGEGGCGRVYLAYDPELNRKVAIKIPHAELATNDYFAKRFQEEGRNLAKISHPNVVLVYDVGLEGHVPYVVMEYVRGVALNQKLRETNGTLGHDRTIEILIQIAAALRETHKAEIVHRDLKPGNIILEETDNIKVVDFGLALNDNIDFELLGNSAEGTPAYMAPEQVRGENHRIGGQTDIWAFGVTMYQLLTGTLPFKAKSRAGLLRRICVREPNPLRQLVETIPKELERICLKCMHKLIQNRYQSMVDLLDDLKDYQVGGDSRRYTINKQGIFKDTTAFDVVNSNPTSRLNSEHTSKQSVTNDFSRAAIVPKGLRSYDAHDAEFFLRLLPGPRDRFGLPDSIRFWKSRIESKLDAFPVGVIYGPSGCGKSSFVQAGLIPNLASHVIPVYVECSTEKTEPQIVRQLAQQVDSIDRKHNLSHTMRNVRWGEHLWKNQKLLIILDQFEQWLSDKIEYENQPLVQALRQCDGIRIQCLILCRDDFWVSVGQFMRLLEIPIQDDNNAMALPLFDKRHARKVLTSFGQAQQDLPDESIGLSSQQQEFIDNAVESLATKNKIICVRLSVLSQMMLGREWTNIELNRLGGLEGVGLSYLDEIFHGAGVPPKVGTYAEPAREILQQLLPDSSETIKGSGKPKSEIFEKLSGIHDQHRLAEAFRFLEEDSELISPAEMESLHKLSERSVLNTQSNSSSNVNEIPFHLTHDFLVTPIREWISQKQKESWRGLARLRFDELAQEWNSRRTTKRPCSFLDLILFQFAIPRHIRANHGAKLMNKSWAYQGKRCICALIVVALLCCLGLWGWCETTKSFLNDEIALAMDAHPVDFSNHLDRIKKHPSLSRKIIKSITPRGDQEEMRRNFLIAHLNPEEFDLKRSIVHVGSAAPEECSNFLQAFSAAEVTETQISPLIPKETSGDVDELKRAFRLAVVLLHLGYPNQINRLLSSDELASQTTRCRIWFQFWHADLSELAELFRELSPNPRRILCNSFSQMENAPLSSREKSQINQWLNTQCQTAATPGLVLSAKNAIESLSFCQLAEAPQESSRVKPFDLTGNHLTYFVQVPRSRIAFGGGLGLSQKRIEEKFGTNEHVDVEEFWVDYREVSASLFFEFVDSKFCDTAIKKRFANLPESFRENLESGDYPIHSITRNEAAQFCNWLNQKHDLPDTYELKGIAWQSIPGAIGFKLPTVGEWELACRAGSDETYFFGDEWLDNRLQDYGWCMNVPKRQFDVGVRGAKIPNKFGIQDIIGNAAEWTDNYFLKWELDYFSIRGGSAYQSPRNFKSGEYIQVRGSKATLKAGFRLVIHKMPGQ